MVKEGFKFWDGRMNVVQLDAKQGRREKAEINLDLGLRINGFCGVTETTK